MYSDVVVRIISEILLVGFLGFKNMFKTTKNKSFYIALSGGTHQRLVLS